MGMQHKRAPHVAGKDHGRTGREGDRCKVRRMSGTTPGEKEEHFRQDIRFSAVRDGRKESAALEKIPEDTGRIQKDH